MTTISVSSAMLAKAEQLAVQASTWLRGTSRETGEHFYLVPGSKPVTAHYSSQFGCTCKSYVNRGECSHRRACQILQRQQGAAIVATVHTADVERQKRYEALFGGDEDPFCVDCNRHHQRGQHYAVAVA
jgi:hypothetical protein